MLGAPIKRKEDIRFITGRGRYVDDFNPPNTVYMGVLRSPYAHAKINNIHFNKEKIKPLSILTGNNSPLKPLPVFINIPGMKPYSPQALASGKARYVGEPVAAIVVDSRSDVEDALEGIQLEYEPLEAVVDAETALQTGSPLLYDEWGTNLIVKRTASRGDVDRAFREAEATVKGRFKIGRQTAIPIENRAVIASFDPYSERLTIWCTSQQPHRTRDTVAEAFNLPLEKVRIIAPDVGGGFGVKFGVYPEYLLATYFTLLLKRPVKWVEDRREHLMSAIHGREQTHYFEMAAGRDGRITGFKDHVVADVGSPSIISMSPPAKTLQLITGCYKLENFKVDVDFVATNKAPFGPVRGNGRPEAILVVEHALDLVAQELKMDPVEVRMRNFVSPRDMPYDSGTGLRYDSGDFAAVLKKACELIDYNGLRKQQEAQHGKGRSIGIGAVCYVEDTGFGPSKTSGRPGYETAFIRVERTGAVNLYTGASPHGQGLETTLAQICAEELTIHPEDVNVVFGDTERVPYGIGTFGSRSAVVAGSAALLAARKAKEKMLAIASHVLDASPESMILGGGVFMSGGEGRSISFRDVAKAAYDAAGLPPRLEAGLQASSYFDPPALTFSCGAHVAVVEVDSETGNVKVLKYVVVDDCGKVLNPVVVHGQIEGGVAKGIGGALLEQLKYDENDQLLTSTLMDYLIASSMDVPELEIDRLETPSESNPLGVKGVGEGGTIGAVAAVVSAVQDALRPFGGGVDQVPLTPEVVWRLLWKQTG